MVIRISWTEESVTSEGESNNVSVSPKVLEFDADERFAVTTKADITQRIIENGAPLSDHKVIQPRRIFIDGLVTNTPLNDPPPSGKGEVNTVVASIQKVGDANILTYSEEFDRVQDVTDILNELVEKPIFVTLETPHRTYERVTVQSVDETLVAPGFGGKRFTVTFQEIFVADTKFVEVPISREPRGEAKRDNSTSDPVTTEAEPPTSWASDLGQGAGLISPIQ